MWDNKYFRGKAVIDDSLNIRTADERFNAFLGDNVAYKLVRSIHPNDMKRLESGIDTVVRGESTFVALRMVNADGVYRWVLIMLESCNRRDGNDILINLQLQDIELYRETIEQLKDNNEYYMEYFSLMEHLLFSYDVTTGKLRIFMTGSHQHINFYSGTLDNWKQEKLANNDVDVKSRNAFEKLCSDLEAGQAYFEHELKIRILECNDEREWCLIKGKTIADIYGKKHVIASMSQVNPVSSGEKLQSEIANAKDVGADILNKRAITNYVKKLFETKPDYNITIAIIDIDNFKGINDRYGHWIGDEVIRNVADIINGAVEGKGVAGRIGGDEMMIVVENQYSIAEIRSILRTIRNNVAWLYDNCDDRPDITCSIGSASYPSDGSNYEEIFNVADKMLYLAKEKGRNRYIIYHNDLHSDYINGVGKAKADASSFYKYRKAGTLNSVINAYCAGETNSIGEAAKTAANIFSLDSIYSYDRQPDGSWKRYIVFGEDVSEEKKEYISSENYFVDFSEEGIKVIDNISFLERTAKAAYEELSAEGICQAVQYIVKEYSGNGRIISFNRKKQMSKWTEADVIYLTLFGNIIGMGFEND